MGCLAYYASYELGLAEPIYKVGGGVAGRRQAVAVGSGCAPGWRRPRVPLAPAAAAADPLPQDNGASTMDASLYHAGTERSQRPATFLTGHAVKQHCYTRVSNGGWARCLQQFPCKGDMLINTLEMGRCYLAMPVGLRMGYLHFVRNPISVVVSAYLYHTQDPPPEDWIWKFNVSLGGARGLRK